MDILRDLAPVSDAYASLPVGEAFDWSVAGGDLGTGEWYMVAFRSIRRPGADEARLCDVRRARPPGGGHGARLRPLLQGPDGPGRILPVVLPLDRTAPTLGAPPAGRPIVEAVGLLHEMYESYTLEFLRVRRLHDRAPLEFEPWYAAPPVHGRPAVDGGHLPEFQPGALPS